MDDVSTDAYGNAVAVHDDDVEGPTIALTGHAAADIDDAGSPAMTVRTDTVRPFLDGTTDDLPRLNAGAAGGGEPPFDRGKPTHGEVKTELFYCVLS